MVYSNAHFKATIEVLTINISTLNKNIDFFETFLFITFNSAAKITHRSKPL